MIERVAAVRARIAAACRRCGRDPQGVRLIGVTKGRAPAQVAALVEAGVRDLGENYLQETLVKHAALAADPRDLRWHFIGHLQRNKAKAAVGIVDVVHGVDSSALATALDRHATAAPLDVLIQVNLSSEPTKSGVAPGEAPALVEHVRRLPHLRLLGFMTMAPPPARGLQSRPSDDASDRPSVSRAGGGVAPLGAPGEAARPYFQQLRALRDAIDPSLAELSMGMSDDFEAAIEEGATMVRIGRALFEDRTAAGER